MDGRITAANAKLLGRTFSLNGTLWLSYSASGAEWEFFGTSCTVTLTGDFLSSDEIHSPRYAIEADGVRIIDTTLVEPMKNTSAAAKRVKHIVIADATPAHHVVRVIKLSESADSILGIEGVMCDGEMHPLAGDPVTIMAGLNCGTPCKVVWPVLRDCSACFCACKDSVTEQGMRAYANPVGSDPAVVSGESGAVTYGLLLSILQSDELRRLFHIDENSVILLISTEGDTDPDGYRRVVE